MVGDLELVINNLKTSRLLVGLKSKDLQVNLNQRRSSYCKPKA